jgi:hypothetical protein
VLAHQTIAPLKTLKRQLKKRDSNLMQKSKNFWLQMTRMKKNGYDYFKEDEK